VLVNVEIDPAAFRDTALASLAAYGLAAVLLGSGLRLAGLNRRILRAENRSHAPGISDILPINEKNRAVDLQSPAFGGRRDGGAGGGVMLVDAVGAAEGRERYLRDLR
jgi:hypothetical protein